jgi:hypothetical protein
MKGCLLLLLRAAQRHNVEQEQEGEQEQEQEGE